MTQCDADGKRRTKPIYVISDLHIGNGSAKDNLAKNDHYLLLMRLLDRVERDGGELVICGDLFELWRYRLEDVLDRWPAVINRLAAMEMVYIPGNHDPLQETRYEAARSWHPLFGKLSAPFIRTLGGRRFKFMHGHEIDPIIAGSFIRWAPMLRLLTGAFELRSESCLMTSDRVTDFLLEAGEKTLRLWETLTRRVDQALHESLFPLSEEGLTRLVRPLRTRNMLTRFYRQQKEGLYDITITGHTHHAGRFDRWYYNCGCWTRATVSYLYISSEGEVSVRNWMRSGEQENKNIVTI